MVLLTFAGASEFVRIRWETSSQSPGRLGGQQPRVSTEARRQATCLEGCQQLRLQAGTW